MKVMILVGLIAGLLAGCSSDGPTTPQLDIRCTAPSLSNIRSAPDFSYSDYVFDMYIHTYYGHGTITTNLDNWQTDSITCQSWHFGATVTTPADPNTGAFNREMVDSELVLAMQSHFVVTAGMYVRTNYPSPNDTLGFYQPK